MSSTHNPGSPQSLKDIIRRDTGAVLAGQRQRSADIRWAVYVKPAPGRGQHFVKNPDNDQAYRVGSVDGATSHAPGDNVALGSNTGHPGEVILGTAPPGRKGSTPPYPAKGGVTLPGGQQPKFYGYIDTGSGVQRIVYLGSGSVSSEGSTLGSLFSVEWLSVIHSDSSSTVGDNSVVISDGEDCEVLDYVNGTTYSYTTSRYAMSQPLYYNGSLYWVESHGAESGGNVSASLVQSNTDLSSPTTLGTETFAVLPTGGTLDVPTSFALIENTHYRARIPYVAITSSTWDVYFNLSTGSSSSSEATGGETFVNFGLVSGSTTYGTYDEGSTISLRTQASGVNGTASAHWPTSAAWTVTDEGSSFLPLDISGTNAMLYSGPTNGELVMGPITAGATPTYDITLAAATNGIPNFASII